MKAGFWVAPEGADEAVNVVAIEGDSGRPGLTASGAFARLASRDGATLTADCPQAIAVLSQIAGAVAVHKSDSDNQLFALAPLSDDERKLVDDVLGEGEVSGVVAMPNGSVAQIQESVLAGIWRVRIESDGSHDYVEVGAIPRIVARAASDLTTSGIAIGTPPEGTMNALPVLGEIRQRALAYRESAPSHVINFSLLPMNEVDMAFLQQSIGNGPVQLVSRGYGSCRVVATAVRNVWSVQFFNSMDNIILDTLEVGGVPTAVCAEDEDFEDSAERLQQIMEAYFN